MPSVEGRLNEDESSSTTQSSEEDEGDRLTLEQELGVANVLLALKERRIADAQNIAKSLPKEISSKPKGEQEEVSQVVTLKTLQLAQIAEPLEQTDELARPSFQPTHKLEGLYELSDDDEESGAKGLVEVETAVRGGEEEEDGAAFGEANSLLAKAIGSETEADRFLQKYFCEALWKRKPSEDQFVATSSAEEPAVVVKELSLEDDLAELNRADAYEAKFNFRHEQKYSITGSHDREKADLFKVVREPSKRALKSREQKAEKKEKVRQAKAKLVEDLEKELPPTAAAADSEQVLLADEDFPSDQEWFLCDGCSTPIFPLKVIFVCSQCPDYCLCKTCQKTVRHDHPLTRQKTPPTAHPPKSWKLCLTHDQASPTIGGKFLAAQILKEIPFMPDQNYKYIKCNAKDEKRSMADLLSVLEKEEGGEGGEGGGEKKRRRRKKKKKQKVESTTARLSD